MVALASPFCAHCILSVSLSTSHSNIDTIRRSRKSECSWSLARNAWHIHFHLHALSGDKRATSWAEGNALQAATGRRPIQVALSTERLKANPVSRLVEGAVFACADTSQAHIEHWRR